MIPTLLDNIGKSPLLIKNGEDIEINIISTEQMPTTQIFKTKIHDTVSQENTFEFIGKGDLRIKLKLFFNTQEEYDNLINFLADGASFVLACSFFPLIAVNLDGNIEAERYYKGWGVATLPLTTAKNPYENDEALNEFVRKVLRSSAEDTLGSKKTFLDKLKDYGKNTFDFISNVNESVGSVTNEIAAYSAAINNIAQGLASSSSIITNPISSVKSSASQVIGGISGVLTSIQNAVQAIKQLPNDLDNLINSLLQIGDQFNDLFDLGNKNETQKYNCALLQSTADSIINADLTPENPAIADSDIASISPEFFLTTIQNKNSEAVAVLILGSILINLYQNAENIDKWNTLDLDKLRISTEKIYDFVISTEISSDFRLQLDLARVRFFKLFKILYFRATKTIAINVKKPSFLQDVVYSINGNLDYYDETKQLNGIIGNVVEGKIMVISNE